MDGKSTLPDSIKNNGSYEGAVENNNREWAQTNEARFEREEAKMVDMRSPKITESNSMLESSQKSSVKA